MAITLKIISGEQSSSFEIPDGSHVTISQNSEVTVELESPAVDYEALSLVKGGPKKRISIPASTTAFEPPPVGEHIDLKVNIHAPDPADSIVRPVAEKLLVTKIDDPSPGLRRSRKIQFEIEASEVEIARIEEYLPLNSFTFRPS